jgi:hypothetical protein
LDERAKLGITGVLILAMGVESRGGVTFLESCV